MAGEQLYQTRKRILPYLFAVLGAVVAVNLVGSFTVRIAPLEIALDVKVGLPGYTLVRIPQSAALQQKLIIISRCKFC